MTHSFRYLAGVVLSLAVIAPSVAVADVAGDAEEFWHYAKIARYQMATDAGKRLLSAGVEGPAALTLLNAMEKVSSERKDNLDEWMLRWSMVPELRDVAAPLLKALEAGQTQRASDPTWIQEHLRRAATNERAYLLARDRLRQSGELAVPIIIDWLKGGDKEALAPTLRRVVRDLGRRSLNPLLAATAMKDSQALVEVVEALGDLGYDNAAPYLLTLLKRDLAEATRAAVVKSLGRLGVAADADAGAQFLQLAEKLYYDRASLQADKALPTANVWTWTDAGLSRVQPPSAIYNEVMAMRACEQALKVDAALGEALSLWIAANFQREVELAGAVDPTRPQDDPSAQFYGVFVGSDHLSRVLQRSLNDRNTAVALRATKALQQIVGRTGFKGVNEPIVAAMAYPDRQVRFEAAFAAALALPEGQFDGMDRVVPVLAEAVIQTGRSGALVLMEASAGNRMVEALAADGTKAVTSDRVENLLAESKNLAGVDVILVDEAIGDGPISDLRIAASKSPRLLGAVTVVICKTTTSPWFQRATSDPTLRATTATELAALRTDIAKAIASAGALPLTPELAEDYALRAARLLERLALRGGSVLDATAAETTLLGALAADTRPEVLKEVAAVLAVLRSSKAQAALVDKALDEATAEELKPILLRGAAASAKLTGNQLDEARVTAITALIGKGTVDVREAAAELHGALNLGPETARSMVLKQAH